jgi:hypothetical protein
MYVSLILCNIFEQIMLNRMDFLELNLDTERKRHASIFFFIVIQYFKKSKTFDGLRRLRKAFDKLWRAELFKIMLGKAEPIYWRILYKY